MKDTRNKNKNVTRTRTRTKQDVNKNANNRKDIVQERKDTSSSPETEASEVCGMKEYDLLIFKGCLKQ